MKRVAILLVALVSVLALTVAGAAGQGIVGGSQNVGLVTMNEQNGSGESGGATLSEVNGQLVVTLDLANGPSTPQPAHIHRGTCANLDPVPLYPLNNVVNGRSETTLSITLADVMNGEYAINVHKSATEAKVYVSCGDLTQMARGGGTNPGAGGTGTNTPGIPTTGGATRDRGLAPFGLRALPTTAAGLRLARRAR